MKLRTIRTLPQVTFLFTINYISLYPRLASHNTTFSLSLSLPPSLTFG